MPKVKSHKGAKKRFKITAGGKVLHSKAGRRHLLTGKPSKRMRRLRRKGCLKGEQAKMVKSLIGE